MKGVVDAVVFSEGLIVLIVVVEPSEVLAKGLLGEVGTERGLGRVREVCCEL